MTTQRVLEGKAVIMHDAARGSGSASEARAPTSGVVIMAAGAGRRMGGMPKSLLQRDGEPLLLRQIRLSAAAGVDAIVVVLGHHAARLTAVLEQSQSSLTPRAQAEGVRWVTNPAPDAGTGSSLRCGLAALPDDLSTWLVMLGDQPLLEIDDVREVLQAWVDRPAGIELVLPRHADRLGHPIAFGAAVRQAVMDAEGGRGVREWRRAHPDRVRTLSVSHPRCTSDLDTPADIDRLRTEYGVALTWPPVP